eukprot:UN12088
MAWNLFYATWSLVFGSTTIFIKCSMLHYVNPFNATVWFVEHVDAVMTLCEGNRLYRTPIMYDTTAYKNNTHPFAPAVMGAWLYLP